MKDTNDNELNEYEWSHKGDINIRRKKSEKKPLKTKIKKKKSIKTNGSSKTKKRKSLKNLFNSTGNGISGLLGKMKLDRGIDEDFSMIKIISPCEDTIMPPKEPYRPHAGSFGELSSAGESIRTEEEADLDQLMENRKNQSVFDSTKMYRSKDNPSFRAEKFQLTELTDFMKHSKTFAVVEVEDDEPKIVKRKQSIRQSIKNTFKKSRWSLRKSKKSAKTPSLPNELERPSFGSEEEDKAPVPPPSKEVEVKAVTHLDIFSNEKFEGSIRALDYL